jgi:N-methylhydantoinase A/oxoprolinase/acetone carboxylase beta subunit
MKLFGVDVGGTFTDVIFTDTEKRVTAIHKVPTTLEDPSTGVVKGIIVILSISADTSVRKITRLCRKSRGRTARLFNADTA